MDELQLLNRRAFIRTGAKLTALAALTHTPLSTYASKQLVKITVLHTNDWHSRIEPFPDNAGTYAGLGGASARAALIKKIRSQEENVLLLDAGDIFQGTPYFNFFEGELEYKLMSEMGYDCATLGNHDFDNGIEGIVNQLRHAKFSFINCNYQFKNTLLDGQIKPYQIIKKSGIRIGVLGVGIELEGLVPKELYGNIQYTDPILAANTFAEKLKKDEKCDLIICLSHLGYKYSSEKVCDIDLAKNTRFIDLIIGGHTHTFLNTPHIQKNLDGHDVVINQVGWAGINLGRIDFFFDLAKTPVNKAVSAVLPISESKC